MNVYALFADELRRAQNGEVDLLDEENGVVARWSAICDESLQVDEDMADSDAWTLERNTWQLVLRLYSERLADASSPNAEGSTSKNPYNPPLTVAQKFIEQGRDLVELSAIREWLHSIPTSLNPAEIRRGYLPYTKNKLKQTKRTGAAASRGLVQELDPDATLRVNAEGVVGRIEPEDASYERALMRSLYEYVRAGDLDLAIDMCRQSDQSWRAASLAGGKLWWDPVLAPGEEGYGDAMELESAVKRAKGNMNRRLWKMMCRKLASAPSSDVYERALYGAISGDTSSVLPVCSSWEDHVWVRINALFEESVEAGLWTSSEGRFWSRGSVDPINSAKSLDVEDALLGTIAKTGTDIQNELKNIFERILKADRVELSQSAKNPFHLSQTYLILGNISDLLTDFVDRLESSAHEMDPETSSHLLRFFAHLVLVMRLLKQAVPEQESNRILEAYVKVLEATNQDESLIAFYASNLDDDRAVKSYAEFLIAFGPDSDRASRRAALFKAQEHGLDLSRIACRTVELILADIQKDAPPTSSSSSLDVYTRVDPYQRGLIRSLEWLTFDPSTFPKALEQANALTRYFLVSAKPHAARELLLQLPPKLLASLAEPDEDDELLHIRETCDFTSFFGCLEQHTRYAETWARKPKVNASKIDHIKFKDGVQALVDAFYTATIDLLSTDWIKLDFDQSTLIARRRSAELAKIRQMFIPELILRLHFTLYDTRDVIPSNLQRALDLANVVADERYRLYLEFISPSGNRIAEYLGHVREAALAALAGGDAFKSNL